MRNARCVKFVIAVFFLIVAAPSIQAIPIKFEFTGTITDKVLISGQVTDIYFNARRWKGKTVTGHMMIDVEGLATNPNQSPEQVYYSSWYGDNPSDWLSFSITNPDGSTYYFPESYDPLSEVDVDGSDVYLINSFSSYGNATALYAGRTYLNAKSLPRQYLSLRLQGSGMNAAKAITSMDFDTVEFNPEFANWENYGIVDYSHPSGKNTNYYFTINSLTRVPEPSSWLLILGGLIALLARRRYFVRYRTMRERF